MAKPTKSRTRSSNHPRAKGPGEVRLIGGSWRGRKLRFPQEEGLRPTGDRIRETLFNWLAPRLPEARCLDLFAGSGALGLEALSRGARKCDFVDTSGSAIKQISAHLETLGATARGSCHPFTAAEFLQGPAAHFDLVFIDPPFRQGLIAALCQALHGGNWLAPGAVVYIETASDEPVPALPDHWAVHREKTSGGVTYRLFLTGESTQAY